jgi:hypothetical protein
VEVGAQQTCAADEERPCAAKPLLARLMQRQSMGALTDRAACPRRGLRPRNRLWGAASPGRGGLVLSMQSSSPAERRRPLSHSPAWASGRRGTASWTPARMAHDEIDATRTAHPSHSRNRHGSEVSPSLTEIRPCHQARCEADFSTSTDTHKTDTHLHSRAYAGHSKSVAPVAPGYVWVAPARTAGLMDVHTAYRVVRPRGGARHGRLARRRAIERPRDRVRS